MRKEYRERMAIELERTYGIVLFDNVSPYKRVEMRELHSLLVRAFEELDFEDREIVLGCCLYERTSREIRDELGLDVGAAAVRLRKKKALGKMSEFLRQQGVGRDYLRAS